MKSTLHAGDRTRATEGSRRRSPVPDRQRARKAVALRPDASQRVLALQAAAGNRAAHGLVAPSPGTPLPSDVQDEMQARLGHDFSAVRIHTEDAATGAAGALGANALTVGSHIAFAPERFAPHTSEGRRLLAHELAHVVQQSRGGESPAIDPRAPHEQSARAAANAVTTTSGPVAVEGATGVGIAADLGDWYEKAKKYAPTREQIVEAAKTSADIALGPAASDVLDLQLAAYTDIKEAVTGVDDPEAKGTQEVARDKIQRNVGRIKGVVGQATDIADTVIWAGTEVRDLKDSAVNKAADSVGVDRSTASKASRVASYALAPVMPGLLAADSIGDLGDEMKEAGLKDESDQASLSAPVLKGWDLIGDWADEKMGGEKTEEDHTLFTQRDIG